MEENKNIESNEEQKSSEGESISFAESIPEVEQPSTLNLSTEALAEADLQPLNPDMEVHHHTHASHGKKSWKSYFWEFLMLFLAVFCGFLAEYQLEHKIEKDREVQFIQSLTSDLQDDVQNLDNMIAFEEQGIAQLDSLITLLNNPLLAKTTGDELYYLARVGPRSTPFANNSRTFDQLKNSGGFRLIRKTASSNRIMEYYNQFSWIRLLEDNYNHEFDNFKKIAAKIFDPAFLRKQEGPRGEIMRSTDNPALRTYDTELLKESGFHVLQMNGSRRSKLLLFEQLKKSAEEVNLYLKKEYHLQ